MVVQIYGNPMSAPYRITVMTAEALGVDYERRILGLGDHKSEWFLKLNPQHNMPFLVDGDFSMNECRAIATYLVRRYGGGEGDDHPLYPSDARLRARVDQRLSFDGSEFYKAFMDVTYPQFLVDPRPPGKIHHFSEKLARMKEVLGWADGFARDSGSGYIAGTPGLSLADLAFAATYSTVAAFAYFDLSEYPDLNAWFARVKAEIPKYKELCGDGAEELAEMWRKRRA